jgi:TolA-binding protein
MAVDGYVDASLDYLSGDDLLRLADEVETMEHSSAQAKRKMLVAKARVLASRGDDSAYDIYRNLANDRTTAEGAEAYYRLVEQNYLSGNSTLAEQMVYDLGECGSMYWQAKCFIILGDIMRDKGNTFQARATYQSIVDGYSDSDDGIVDEAQSRINSL